MGAGAVFTQLPRYVESRSSKSGVREVRIEITGIGKGVFDVVCVCVVVFVVVVLFCHRGYLE